MADDIPSLMNALIKSDAPLKRARRDFAAAMQKWASPQCSISCACPSPPPTRQPSWRCSNLSLTSSCTSATPPAAKAVRYE